MLIIGGAVFLDNSMPDSPAVPERRECCADHWWGGILRQQHARLSRYLLLDSGTACPALLENLTDDDIA